MAALTATEEDCVEVPKEVEEWLVVTSGPVRLATEAAWARLAAVREAAGWGIAEPPLEGPVAPPRVRTASSPPQAPLPPLRRAPSPVQRSTRRLIQQ